MNDSLFFVDPVFPGWLLVLLILPLFSFLIWKEFRRKQKFLLFRIVAILLVLISVLGLLFKPGRIQEIKSTGLVLLTPGYSEDQIDSLLGVRPELGFIHAPGAKPYRNSRLLSSYQNLADLDQEILFIVGEGIPTFALELMDVKKFQFIGSPKPIGIVDLHLQQTSRTNQLNTLTGVVNASSKATVTLYGPGGREDSVRIAKGGMNSFSLKFNPKQAGLFLYTLEYRDGSGTQTGQVPVVAADEQKLTILFLQKFPSFEVRQLKNFLAENGHRLALRYQVSKGNYREEFANISSLRTSPLTTSVLQQFDLVVVDGEGLEALSTSERNSLEGSIHEGLGLILLMNKTSENDMLRERFLPIQLKRNVKDTVFLKLSTKPYMLPTLPWQVAENSSVFQVTKKKERVLSVYSYNGFGKTGLQLMRETYRIALEGNKDDYAAIWSPLIERTARQENENVKIKLRNSFPIYEDEPLAFQVISVGEQLTARNDQYVLPVTEHVTIDNVWLGNTWAGKPGWHTFSVDSTRLHYFVSDSSAWKTLRLSNQRNENELASMGKSGSSKRDIFYERKPISPVIFYMLFLVGTAFLWLAPKI